MPFTAELLIFIGWDSSAYKLSIWLNWVLLGRIGKTWLKRFAHICCVPGAMGNLAKLTSSSLCISPRNTPVWCSDLCALWSSGVKLHCYCDGTGWWSLQEVPKPWRLLSGERDSGGVTEAPCSVPLAGPFISPSHGAFSLQNLLNVWPGLSSLQRSEKWISVLFKLPIFR